MNKIVNLTPHDINIIDENGDITATFPPSGTVARVARQSRHLRDIETPQGTIPLYEAVYGDVVDLPTPDPYPETNDPDTYYIVSRMVVDALGPSDIDISDLLTPGELVRDDQGNIIGCRGLEYSI